MKNNMKKTYPWNIMRNANDDKLRNSSTINPLTSLHLNKLQDYLYEITYDTDFNYEEAEIYMSKFGGHLTGKCSAARKNNIIGRNYDWLYDETAEFIIHAPKTNKRLESISIAAGFSKLSNQFVQSGEWTEEYNYLPFYTLDGINECGVFVEDNVVSPGDYGWTTDSNPGQPKMMALMIPRFILDNATSVNHAIDLLNSKSFYCAFSTGLVEEFHVLVADKNKTVEIEFIHGKMKIIENPKAVTNFYLYNFDGITATGFETGGISPEDTTLTAHAMGVERYDILQNNIDNITDENTMTELMKSIWYTKAYDTNINPFWYSEFVGETNLFGDLTIYMDKSKYNGIIEYVTELFKNRSRNGKTWQTVHTSIYNLENKTVNIITQEGNTEIKLKL